MRLLTAIPGRRDDAIAIVNGLFGDSLEGRDSRFATPMALRAAGIVLPLTRTRLRDRLKQRIRHPFRTPPPRSIDEALTAAGIEPGPRICILVHGLMSTESIWRYPDHPTANYGTRLAVEHGVTNLTLRYNTGRSIPTNGREFAEILNRLVQIWPTRIEELNLIGHSMGGLVIRSACYYGRDLRPLRRRVPVVLTRARGWTTLVRRVVLIGVPNTGAGLEAFVNSLSASLSTMPVPGTRVVANGLERRSAGIKDLRFGTIRDDLDGTDIGQDTYHLVDAEYLIVAGSITADPEHPLARRIGDALVTSSSAFGVDDDIELFPGATIGIFPKVTHNALAHNVDVYAAITAWW
jgi:pimeloyl-ACP methyl ester carboxylesterase